MTLRLVAIAALVLALCAGTAAAAAPPAGTVGPATPSVSWQGQVYAQSVAGSCPSQAADPANVVCDHFTLDVQSPGTVTVGISWPDAQNDFDLYVYEGDTLVASSTSASGTSESVTFAADAATYEVRVVPTFIAAPSGYSGTATWASSATGGGGAATTCSPATIEISLEPILDVCIGLGL